MHLFLLYVILRTERIWQNLFVFICQRILSFVVSDIFRYRHTRTVKLPLNYSLLENICAMFVQKYVSEFN